ncbi:ROK family transcriptional regulator [Paenibacillus sp. WQ 127069]|uniref:ROK family transcriptional regulator n=1 Tax=Paenibacillus baimaensis TaxID=2982185 RepID=A0ABT2UBJ0_9BACL|nr:ROK family transcriptional regulator [Paenibacillus sp. WQ 127069]MCU6791049.1 ROK family transcriptional regulator [Paenibacillus sp. WQ 127069]
MLLLTARVLQLIRRARQPLSKAEIANETGISLSAVSVHVDRLMQEKLIMVSHVGASSGGRKPKQYAIHKNHGIIVSIELGISYVQVAIADFDCEIIAATNSPSDINQGPDAVLPEVQQLVDHLLQEYNLDKSLIKGIGIGVPGPVDFSLGTPIAPPIMPGWDQYPIREFWFQHYACPCYVDNDVNNMVLGEYAKGLNFEVDNLIHIKVGTGIGSGVIYDGKLYRGSTGSAGDIGHFDIGNDVMCWCGNRGCLEANAGGKAIVEKAKQLALSGKSEYLLQLLERNGRLTLDDLGEGLLKLDPASVELIRESGAAIGKVIASIVNFSNPSLISIGGKLSEFGDIFLAAIRQSVYQRSMPLATRKLMMNKSLLGSKAGLIGGAYMTIDQLILQATNDDPEHFLNVMPSLGTYK